jgi:DNA-binding NarL/FixJ family response regulator
MAAGNVVVLGTGAEPFAKAGHTGSMLPAMRFTCQARGCHRALPEMSKQPRSRAQPDQRSPCDYTIAVALGRCDPIVSIGLAQILSEDQRLRVVGRDLDGEALKRVVLQQKPQIVILDEASVVDLSLLRHLKMASADIRTVVLAHRPLRSYSMRLFAAGATCVPKDAAPEGLLAAIHLAARSEAPAAGALSLTQRQVTVLKHLCEGKSHKEIADALGISIETVRTHSARIRRQLGVKSKRELIGMPMPIGLESENGI